MQNTACLTQTSHSRASQTSFAAKPEAPRTRIIRVEWAETAIFVTVDQSDGYYDSLFTQPVGSGSNRFSTKIFDSQLKFFHANGQG